MSLLTDLRDTGEKLLEAELPSGQELRTVLGALIAHIESKGEQWATVELDKLTNKLQATEPTAPSGQTQAELEAQLEALKATAAGSAAPAIVSEGQPAPIASAPPPSTV